VFSGQKAEKKLWRQLFENKKWIQIIGYVLALIFFMGMANYYQENTGTPWLTLLLFLGIIIVPLVWMIRPKDPNWRTIWITILGFVLFAVSLYPPISLYNRMRLCSGFKYPTLNGIAYLDRLLAKEAKAIKWINANINQMDIILEAPGKRGYNCFDTRIAIFTGHPSLIGWVGQEEQMRYNSELTGSRTRDADRIYNTLNIKEAKKLINHYQIEYVFVGQNERQAYSLQGLEKFQHFMNVVYDQEGIKLYKKR